MIRAATLSDLPRLLELMTEMTNRSKFAPDIGIDEPTARSLLMQGVRRHGGTNSGSSCLFVEDMNGLVEGFIMGILDRVYYITNRLAANDLFLYCIEGARARAHVQLIDHYVKWAKDNPKVAYIMLSWTDALGVKSNKLERLYKRKEFHNVGAIWERKNS